MATINENLDVLEVVKEDIKEAIENKGVVIDDNTPFTDYATKIDEISSGSGDYQDGFEQGKAVQKALLENRTFHRNGTYARPDGYGTVVVDVPNTGGNYEEGYEQGKADQKALLTSKIISSNGIYTNENGWNEVVVDIDVNVNFFGALSKTMMYEWQDIYRRMLTQGEDWLIQRFEYGQQNPNLSSNGMMYGNAPITQLQLLGDVLVVEAKDMHYDLWSIPVWGEKSLVTPWVYNENNSPSITPILPDCILGGFECGKVEYIRDVFQGAESLKVFLWLHNLGKAFTSVNTLDLSILTDLNNGMYPLDSFIEMANSVYNFAVDGMNTNGVSYSNVKLPSNATNEQIDAWVSKGWRVLQ